MRFSALFLLFASVLPAREVVKIYSHADVMQVQKLLDEGYTVKACTWRATSGAYDGFYLFVLTEPSDIEAARNQARVDAEKAEAARLARIKADFEKRRTEYLKSLPAVEKHP